MSEIQRWQDLGYDPYICEHDCGEWVKFDDHAAIVTRLESRLAAAEETIARLKTYAQHHTHGPCDHDVGVCDPLEHMLEDIASYDAAKETA